MMKFYKIILSAIFITILISSCEDQLTKQPDFISENSVFESESLTNAYMANLYSDQLFIDLGGQANYNMGMLPAAAAEHINFANWQTPNSTYRRTYSEASGAGPLGWWPYGLIRDTNYLLEHLPNSATLSDSYVNQTIAEARWLRAFTYFEITKRYGAVPLITRVQEDTDPEEELYPSRTSEKDMYDFIISELDAIIPVLTAAPVGAKGKIDKHSALAFKSRAALYAASIAKYGEVQLDGQLGFPSSDAQAYYQMSYNAAKELIDSGVFALYNVFDDKERNYSQLFLDEANSEIIFAEVFEPFVKGTSFDRLAVPADFNSTWNSNFPVLYDFVELFDFIDGRKGTDISRDDLVNGNTWDIKDFFGNRDPRFRASVFYPESKFQGGLVYGHTNTTYTNNNGETITTDAGNLDRNGEVWPARAHVRILRNTALLLRKKVDESLLDPLGGASGQDFYVFRYGEILLNFAEAAVNLSRNDEALDAINLLRDRAGMPSFVTITEEDIQHERQVELCFEGHRYWDLIRWRISPTYLDGVRTKGLIFNYNLDTDLYTIRLKNAEGADRTFGPERFYLPLSSGLLADNPNLRPNNPGY